MSDIELSSVSGGNFFTRPAYGITSVEKRFKKASPLVSSPQEGSALGVVNPVGSDSIPRGPSRKWYEPEYTGLSLLLPKNRIQKNRWRRYFYMYDPIIGGVVDLHAEMPHSPARLFGIDDQEILDHYLKAVERVDLWNLLPEITREYLKIGEAFPYLRWDDDAKNFSHIILQNPDFIEIETSMFVDEEDKYYLTSDPRLKSLIEGNEPTYRDVKSRLPVEFLRFVFYGERIPLPFDEKDLFIALIKKNSPSDVRGTSIIDRTFKYLIYEDKLLDSQIAIADNVIFPIRMFKFGNEHWTPNEEQLAAFQETLLSRKFDPDFYFLTHNAVTYESHSLSNDIMSLGNEWERIDKVKMIALGISQGFMTGESSYASAHVAFQTAIARYRTLRSMIESQFLNKFFKTIAERAGFYKVSLRELNGNYRVSSNDRELILPRLDWEKKLTVREEESYLSFLQGLMGKFPISESTFLSAIGMSLKDELLRSIEDNKLKLRLGIKIKDDFSGGTKEDDEGDESGLFASLFKRKKKYGSSSDKVDTSKGSEISDYLFRLAKSIVYLEKKRGVEKTVDEVYAELLNSYNENDVTDNFFTGNSTRVHSSLSGEFIRKVNKSDNSGVVSDVNSVKDDVDLTKFNENYSKNYYSLYPDRVRYLLKRIHASISEDVLPDVTNVISLISDLISESIIDGESIIRIGNRDVDLEFIKSFLKSDVSNSVYRYSSNRGVKDSEYSIKKIVLASILLGYSQYYSSQGIEDIFIASPEGLKKVSLAKFFNGGIDSISAFVENGLLPYIIPIVYLETDLLRKAGFLTSFTVNNINIENCPKPISLFLTEYIKYGSKYFLSTRGVDNQKPIKRVIFCDSVGNHPDFKRYVKESYSIKDEDSYQFILDNEKRKVNSKKNFVFSDTLYVNFDILEDFSSLFDCFEYLLPLDRDKFSKDKKYLLTKNLTLSPEQIESGISEGWLVRYSQSDGDLYRVATRIKSNIYTFAEYYDLIGFPVILDSSDSCIQIFKSLVDFPHLTGNYLQTVFNK